MRKVIDFIPRYLPSVLVVLAILYLTLVPKPLPDTDMKLFPHADKVVHAIMFGGAYLCFYIDTRKCVGRITGKRIFFLMAVTVLFGGLIEILQDAMGLGRGGDWLDFLADAAGVCLSAFMVNIFCGKEVGLKVGKH